MIPESLRKQIRAHQLFAAKYVTKRKLSESEEAELKVLEDESKAETKRFLRRTFAQLRADKAYQKRMNRLMKRHPHSFGTY